MKQNYAFIAASYYFRITNPMNKGTVIASDGLRISNSSDLQNITDEYMIMAIGMLEYEQLSSVPYYYSKGVNKDGINLFETENGVRLIDGFLSRIQVFNTMLWFIKDHSINTELGYLKVENERETFSHSTSRTVTFYNSKGLQEDTEFTLEELRSGKEMFDALADVGDVFSGPDYRRLAEKVYSYKRIERSLYFLDVARTVAFVPLRISNFVTVLETLLSTSSTEVTHKLKERLAWILGKDIEHRKSIFKMIGDVYSVRSNCVHGNSLPKTYRTQEKLTELSMNFEGLVREFYKKLLSEEELISLYKRDNDSEIEAWLNEKCLGGPFQTLTVKTQHK